MRCAGRTLRNERFVTVEFESDPTERGAHDTSAGIVDVQRVSASEVDGGGGGSVDNKLAGGGPDVRDDRPTIEGNVFSCCAHVEEPHACAGFDLDLSDIGRLQSSARLIVGLKNLSDRKAGPLLVHNFCADAR